VSLDARGYGSGEMEAERSASNGFNGPETIWGELALHSIILVPWGVGWALYICAVVLGEIELY
jgi:hypothetical protein